MSNCKTISVCNQKGGVGKTTTTVNLGVGLAMQGKKVLLIDADPQGDLTTCLGWQDTDGLGITLATKLTDVINETMTDPMVGILHHEEGVDLVPANLELSAMEFNLVNAMSRETTLKNYLSQVKNRYDYVIIDCMPSLGMVTLNALSAADSVIIPVQAQYLPAKGMTQLVQTISKVKKYINPDIKIDGMLLTLVDSRTNLAKSTVEALRAMEVVSADRNAEMLENVPHEQMEDMAVVYRLILDQDSEGRSSVLVTNDLMEQFGITHEQLHDDAMVNAPEIRPSEIRGRSVVMTEMMGPGMIPEIDPADEQMFVAGVSDNIHGAGVIAYPNFFEDAAEKEVFADIQNGKAL